MNLQGAYFERELVFDNLVLTLRTRFWEILSENEWFWAGNSAESARCESWLAGGGKACGRGSRLVRAPHVHAAPSFGRYIRVRECGCFCAYSWWPAHFTPAFEGPKGLAPGLSITGAPFGPSKAGFSGPTSRTAQKGARNGSSCRALVFRAPTPNTRRSGTEPLCTALSVIIFRSIIRV